MRRRRGWDCTRLVVRSASSILFLSPLLTFPAGTIDSGLKGRAASSPVFGAVSFVADVGADVAWLVLPVEALWLLIRRLPSSATYVAVAAIGSAVLTTAGPVPASRLPPLGGAVVTGTEKAGLLDEGILGLTITSGVLLLVFLPVVPSRARAGSITTAVVITIAYGGARVILGPAEFCSAVGASGLGRADRRGSNRRRSGAATA